MANKKAPARQAKKKIYQKPAGKIEKIEIYSW